MHDDRETAPHEHPERRLRHRHAAGEQEQLQLILDYVPAAILFDLGVGGDPSIRPDADCGYRAAEAAGPGPVPEGSVDTEFRLTTRQVASPRTAEISATYGGETLTVNLRVDPRTR